MSAEDKLVMEKTFQMLDEDKVGFSLVSCIFRLLYILQDGFITAKDLKTFFLAFQRKLSDEDINKIINDGDENGDNKIDLSEFVNIMNKS